MCVCVADTEQLETHLEAVRRRHDESRDPLVQELRGLVEGIQQQDEARQPLYAQLGELGGQLRAAVDGVQASSAHTETLLQQRMQR